MHVVGAFFPDIKRPLGDVDRIIGDASLKKIVRCDDMFPHDPSLLTDSDFWCEVDHIPVLAHFIQGGSHGLQGRQLGLGQGQRIARVTALHGATPMQKDTGLALQNTRFRSRLRSAITRLQTARHPIRITAGQALAHIHPGALLDERRALGRGNLLAEIGTTVLSVAGLASGRFSQCPRPCGIDDDLGLDPTLRGVLGGNNHTGDAIPVQREPAGACGADEREVLFLAKKFVDHPQDVGGEIPEIPPLIHRPVSEGKALLKPCHVFSDKTGARPSVRHRDKLIHRSAAGIRIVIQHHHTRPGPCRTDRGGPSCGPRADDQHIRFHPRFHHKVILFKLTAGYSSIFPILHQDRFNRDFRAER